MRWGQRRLGKKIVVQREGKGEDILAKRKVRKRRGISVREERVTTERAQQHRVSERSRGRVPLDGISAVSELVR